MVFYTKEPPGREFSGETERERSGSGYSLSVGRLVGATVFLTGLLLLSFLAWYLKWPEGSAAILHMAEVAFGGIAGLLFGERGAVK
jgi:hypothetical protein